MHVAGRLPPGGDRRRRLHGQRAADPVPRRQPARMASRSRPGDGRGDAAGRRRADEAAQHQRRAYQPLPAASGLPRPVRRVRAVGGAGERSGDPRLSSRSAGATTRATIRAGGRPTWTACSAPSNGTRTIPAWSCGRWATRAGTARTSPRWPTGSTPATRAGRCTTRATGTAATSTSTAACTRRTPRSTRSGDGAEASTKDPALDAHRRAIPFLQCEYAHAMGNGPGRAAPSTSTCSRRYPRMAGGFVWEWIDHGIRQQTADGREFFALRRRLRRAAARRQLHARRAGVPRPHAVARAGRVRQGDRPRHNCSRSTSGIVVRNARDFADLGDLRFEWVLEDDGVTAATGELAVPQVAAGASVQVPLPDLPETIGETWFTVRAVQAAATPWAPPGHQISFAQVQLRSAPGRPVAAPAPRSISIRRRRHPRCCRRYFGFRTAAGSLAGAHGQRPR